MEKPVTPDGFSSRKMLELNEKAKKKTSRSGSGSCADTVRPAGALCRIKDGEIGQILNLRAYRMQGPIASCFSPKTPPMTVT